jgi:hypothetical protein
MTTADVVRALRTGTVAMWTVGTLLLWGLAASLIGTLWRRQRVVVGRDGVRIHGPWRMQYIPFEIIQSVTGTSPILLHLDNARRVRLRETEHARGLAKRIRAQMRRWSNERRVGVNPRLDRGDKSVAEWKEALAAGQHDGYRNTSMRLEDLDDLVKDPRAAPEQRVGAALTLASDDAARQRIRIAAEACADPDMEAALEAAAEGEVDERALQRAQHHRAQSS